MVLAKSSRLRKSGDIARVYARGRFGGAGVLHAKSLKNGWDQSRAVVVVSRKVSNKAVVRNRIRRRISADLQKLWQTVAPGYDIVVSVREDVSKLEAVKLETALKQALNRSGVMEKEHREHV